LEDVFRRKLLVYIAELQKLLVENGKVGSGSHDSLNRHTVGDGTDYRLVLITDWY